MQRDRHGDEQQRHSLPAATYTLSVTAPGFAPATLSDVVVTKDDCGFDQTVTRTIVLNAP